MKMSEIVQTMIMPSDPRTNFGRLKDEMNHVARSLGIYENRKDYSFTEAEKIKKEFYRQYPPRNSIGG